MTVPEHAYAVILAGGGGTRLWPKSRQKTPKHLLKLFGKDSMLQLTYNRIAEILPPDRVFVITHQNHLAQAQEQLPDIPEGNWIVEPQAKNTALAMGVASAVIGKHDPQAAIVNLAADQVIDDEDKFLQTLVAGLEIAGKGEDIVSIGIRPSFPHTGLGYIRTGEQVDAASDRKTYVFASRGFKEKPDLATAQSFLASGQYLWNANLYCWSYQTITKAMQQYAPEIAEAMARVEAAWGTSEQQSVMEKVYEQAESVQIDIAVSEKAQNLVVIPGDFGWSDIGDWKVMYDNGKKDNRGNVVSDEGSFVGVDTYGSLIETNGRLVAVIGLRDVVVVDTDDALLICEKSRSQDVKKIVEQLKEGKRGELL